MEMPEGFINAYGLDTSTDGGRQKIHEALDLMKEMAEALEIINSNFTTDTAYISNIKGINLSKFVLKKFKEWK